MQKLLVSKQSDKLTVLELEKFYISGEKEDDFIGLEYERLALDKKTNKPAKYENVSKIIEQTAKILGWDLIFDKSVLIGAKDNLGTSISLEPGMQLELSLAFKKEIAQIETSAKNILNLIDKVGDIYNVKFLGYGISDVENPYDIEILNKQRYKIMNDYLPYCKNAQLCPDMMRKTAGIQVNIDYKNKKDCFNKLKFFNLISPFMCALSANSPKDKYKSYRAYVWQNTGSQRCNFFYKNALKKLFFNYRNYIEQILDVPMVYIERDDKNIVINGKITFREFMKSGYMGYFATYDDYILHQSLCFPDVRLKNYIEIRNHDSNSIDFALALCAFYKGILKCDFNKLIKEFSYLNLDDVEKYNENVAILGLEYDNSKKIISTLVEISKKHLSVDERKYLEPIIEKY